jgi:hypothetical protein
MTTKHWTGVTKRLARDPGNKGFDYADTVAPADAPATPPPDYMPPQKQEGPLPGDRMTAPQQEGNNAD